MAAERLLERLSHWGKGEVRLLDKEQQQDRLLLSVQRHLSEILSTREGSTLINPDLGLANNLELLSIGHTEKYAQHIVTQIQQFEPRLLNPEVQVLGVDPSRMQLNCSLSGQLGGTNKTVRFLVSIQTSSGKVLVDL